MKKKLILGIFIGLFLTLIGLSFLFVAKPGVNLVYMSDSKYLPYMMTSLYSAIKNKNKTTVYNVHVIAQDFSKEDINKLKQLEQETVQIKIYPAEDKNLDMSHLGRFASFKISLQKLFISAYLQNVEKALYLDADTLVLKDLSTVYRTPLRGYYAAAVKDGLMYQFPEHIKEIGLEWRNFYFNSGIMLLNLNKMREDDIIRSAIIYFNTHEEVFGDQDVLNVVFADKVKPISYRYNCNSTFFEEKDAAFLSEFYGEPVPSTPLEVYKNAVILHFAGHKPWTEWFTHPYLKPLWQSYAEELNKKYLRHI